MQLQHRYLTTLSLPPRQVRILRPRRRRQGGKGHLGHLSFTRQRRHQGWKALRAQPPTTTSTDTVFDGSTPRFPEWIRELRVYLNISQFEHIDLLDFAYDTEQPLTTDIMAQQMPAGRRQHQEKQRLQQARQDLQDELAQPPGDHRRANADINNDLSQTNNDLNAQQLLYDATTTAGRHARELLGHLIMHSAKPNSEPNNLLRRLQ